MSVTINAKGTSVPYFKLGKTGSTLYQGSSDPTGSYTVLNGDVWFDTSTNLIKFRSSGSWVAGTGTVTNVSVTTANGVSGSVSNSTTTPAITLTLGAITPASVAATGTVTGINLSGTNTGDQTITLTGDVTGSGTGSFATTLATVNSSPQTDQFRKITVNGKGLVTASTAVTTSDITALVDNTYVNVSGDTMTGTLNLPTDGLVVGTTQLVASSGNIGIGASPNSNYKLDVSGIIRSSISTGGSLYLSDSNNLVAIRSIPVSSDSAMGFYTQATTGNNERMRIDAIGNVGIGTAPTSGWEAGAALQMQSETSYSRYGYSRGVYYDGSTYRSISGLAGAQIQMSGGGILFRQSPTTTAGAAVTMATSVILDTAGNIGIGTSSPQNRLHVVGTDNVVRIDSYGSAGSAPGPITRTARGTVSSPTATQADDFIAGPLGMGYGTTGFGPNNTVAMVGRAEANFTDTSQPTYIRFDTTASGAIVRTERMRVTSAGLVGIGTSTPLSQLHVNANSTPANIVTNTSTLHISGADATGTSVTVDAFATVPGYFGRRAQGTAASKSAIQANQNLVVFDGSAYGATGYSSGSRGGFRILASENWTDTAQGTYCTINTTANGGTTLAEVARFDNAGKFGLGTTPSAWLSGAYAMQIGTGGSIDSRGTQNFELGNNLYMDAATNWKFINNGFATQYVQDSGIHRWLYSASGTAGNTISLNEALRIDTGGNLGLACTPVAWGTGIRSLDINTYGSVASSTNSFELYSNSYYNGTNFIYKSTAAATKYTQTGGQHTWYVAPSGTAATTVTYTQAATIDNSGNMGVGVSPVASNGILQLGSYASVKALLETATVTAAAPSSTTNFDLITQAVQYYTSNATTNFTLNIRGNSGTSLNTIMQTGQSATLSLLVTNGGTAFRPTAFQIDGNAVTPKWQGGTAPSAGNINSIDIYTFTVIKTASATFTVLATQTQFA